MAANGAAVMKASNLWSESAIAVSTKYIYTYIRRLMKKKKNKNTNSQKFSLSIDCSRKLAFVSKRR